MWLVQLDAKDKPISQDAGDDAITFQVIGQDKGLYKTLDNKIVVDRTIGSTISFR